MNQTIDPSASSFRRLGLSMFICLVFASTFVLVSLLVEGAAMAARTATQFAMPMGVIWLLTLLLSVNFWLHRRWLASVCLLAIFLLIAVVANSYVATWFMQSVEWPEVTTTATSNDPYRAAIVLGGAVSHTALEVPELHRDGERIFSAAQLWHAGLVSSIICTGASSNGLPSPSEAGKELLVSVGVPAEKIYELGGENTSQEMKHLRDFFDAPPSGFPESGNIVLITSAFHMQRAMRLASDQSLEFEPHPCAYRSSKLVISPRGLIPHAGAAADFGYALKERLAVIVGR